MSASLFYSHFVTKGDAKSNSANDLVRTIRKGELQELEAFIKRHAETPDELAEIINTARDRLQCREITIPYAIVARIGSPTNNKSTGVTVLSIYMPSVHRVLSICSSPAVATVVMGPSKQGQTTVLTPTWEDPAVLLKQIGRLASMPSGVTPPPLAHAFSAA